MKLLSTILALQLFISFFNTCERCSFMSTTCCCLFNSRFKEALQAKYFRPDGLTMRPSEIAAQLSLVRRLAIREYKTQQIKLFSGATSSNIFSPAATNRTKQAARDFYALSYQLLAETGCEFPLANKNKCLGIAVIKTNKSVFLALSEDRDARQDLRTRAALINFLQELNKRTTKWRFELVKTPSPMEFLLPRSLRMETSRPASDTEIQPRMRCVEVQLMVALNKVRRTIKYSMHDVAMLALGGTLWASRADSTAVDHFGYIERNRTYISELALELQLYDGRNAYIDVWEPCAEHCKIYYNEMLAFIGADEHFLGPRADAPLVV